MTNQEILKNYSRRYKTTEAGTGELVCTTGKEKSKSLVFRTSEFNREKCLEYIRARNSSGATRICVYCDWSLYESESVSVVRITPEGCVSL